MDPHGKWLTQWDGQTGERHGDGGYAALWSRDVELGEEPTATDALTDLARDLAQWLLPDPMRTLAQEAAR